MGVDVGDFDNSGRAGVAITNFDNEMIGLYRADASGNLSDIAVQSGVGLPSKTTLGFGCAFADYDIDGSLDLIAVNGHIDDTVRNVRNVGYAQPPQLFLNLPHCQLLLVRTLRFSVMADQQRLLSLLQVALLRIAEQVPLL